MIDCTSSLYLGMKHSSAELKSWQQLTTGIPAALCEHALSKETGKQVAAMQGLEEGINAPSTLHLYWDLFGWLSKQPVAVFADEQIYPVSKYGIEKLQCSNTPVFTYKHLHAAHLASQIHTKLPKGKRPVVLCDGWCPLCGKAAPVQEYIKIIQPFQGLIIIDDTQAFGILGAQKTKAMPYGTGGGGILKWLNVHEGNVITVVSLAKAFGVPMAVISGDAAFISAFEQNSITRVNSSPVSMAHLYAAANAFSISEQEGDERRIRLWSNVSLVKKRLSSAGIKLQGGIFPVQSINTLPAEQTIGLYNKLKAAKIKTVLIKQHHHQQPALCCIVRCDHTEQEMEKLCSSIRKCYLSFIQKHALYGNFIR